MAGQNQPVSDYQDIVIQNTSTGQVDYLTFQGNQLMGSQMDNYNLNGFNVVASGDFNGATQPAGLVTQNPNTGFLDFLNLDANANLLTTAMSNVSVPTVVGEGNFGSPVQGQVGPDLVSQLANGQLDVLAFDGNGNLLASGLVANSMGLAPASAVVGGTAASGPAFAGVGSAGNENVITQLPDGSVDVIGFSGASIGSLAVSATDDLASTIGSPHIFAGNQDNHTFPGQDDNTISNGSGHQTVGLIGLTPNGGLDQLFLDLGYTTSQPAFEGSEFATLLESTGFPGWQVVDGGAVATQFFPIKG